MLQYPLRFGPAEELRWFVAEMDALTRLHHEAPPIIRERFVEETRHWAMRELRNGHKGVADHAPSSSVNESHGRHRFADLMAKFGEPSIVTTEFVGSNRRVRGRRFPRRFGTVTC
jgi:hypothetical protein